MRRSIRKPLLAAWALILCPSLRGAEVRFRPEVPAADAARWEPLVRESWSAWESRVGVTADRPEIEISLVDPERMPSDFGRVRGGRIALNRLLTRSAADAVVRHEVAHVFFESRCPGLESLAPLVSESFALWVSGDAARRDYDGTRFLFASAARDWLLANAGEIRGDTRKAQQALARVMSQPSMEQAWEDFFAGTLGACRGESFAASRAQADLLDVLRGVGSGDAPSRADFLLIDGLSGEAMAQDGNPRARFPAGSMLKPSLLASVPALMESRPARPAAEWHCPGAPNVGEMFTWQRALAASCNGFFLDFADPSPDAFAVWEDEMRRLGVSLPQRPTSMEDRIGLSGAIAVSPWEAVRLYTWLDRKAPFVVDALTRTARDGTISSAPDSGWFRDRRVALKTGTVRDTAGRPIDSWVVAVGPRDVSGAPAFVAALHANNRATPSLLPELKRRLTAALTGLERSAQVQILGLVPESSVGVACAGASPMLVRSPAGVWRLETLSARRTPGSLAAGETFVCPAAPLEVTFEDGHRAPKKRNYFGALTVEVPLPLSATDSSVPLRERSARARRGSRFLLTTSERSYAVSSLLSEMPSGHVQLLAALSLVVRNNRLTRRHGDRPPCDTTHCSLFGQDGAASAAARSRAERAVALAAPFEIAAESAERPWLPFYLGGSEVWTEHRAASEVSEALGLDGEIRTLTRLDDGVFEAAAYAPRRFPCEVLRNQLRLPSCPEEVRAVGGEIVFRGRGEGHGEGLDLTSASAAAAEGADFRALLARAWPDLRLTPSAGGFPELESARVSGRDVR